MTSAEFYSLLFGQYSKQDTNSYSYYERKKAWQFFEKQGLPHSKSEYYRFFYPYLYKNFLSTELSNVQEVLRISDYLYDLDVYHLVIINGSISFAQSRIDGHEDFFSIHIGEKAFSKKSSIISNLFRKNLKVDPFIFMNDALYKQDIFISIKKDAKLDKPLLIYAICDESKSFIVNTRIYVKAEANSSSEIIFSNQNKLQPGMLTVIQNLISLDSEAAMNFYTIQESNNESFSSINNTSCILGNNSKFNSFFCDKSIGCFRNNLNVYLNSRGAHASLCGLAIPGHRSFIDNHTFVSHNVPNTSSEELYRNIISDNSEVVFNGEIYVAPDAQKTQAFQSNDSILLSENATVHTKPQLEIFADDVKCSHGATVGELDMEKIFYLRSRGISKEIAESILLDSFADLVLHRINNSDLKRFIEYMIF